MKFSLALIMLTIFSTANASLVAIIDSGVDVDHPELAAKIWTNQGDDYTNGQDDDQNGYTDDFYGWNFVGNNNKVINMEHASTFSSDVEKFYELQYLMYAYNQGENIFTQEFLDWYYDVMFPGNVANQELLALGESWGGYSHGTHVAGIVANNNPEAEILSVKLLGSAKLKLDIPVSLRNENADAEEATVRVPLTDEDFISLKSQLKGMAADRSKKYIEIFKYVGDQGSKVANGSFGTGYKMTLSWLSQALPAVDMADIHKLTYFFQAELIKGNEIAVASAPNTLFVFAAGNDQSNIDEYLDSPAGVVADNSMSVAATWGWKALANFSCTGGQRTVQVAAPGVGIKSTVPGGHYLHMNGTSQAAPYVARVAAKVTDVCTSCSPKDVKEIIMATVDYKPWLEGVVTTSGIVNEERAVAAAEYFNAVSLSEAVEIAKSQVADVVVESGVMTNSILGPVKVDIDFKPMVTKRPSPITFE